MGTTIYYFSGTGNSLKVAKDLAEQIEGSKLVQIRKGTFINEDLSEKIGIVFPVYYYGLPVMVKEFIENLKLNKNNYVFAAATCGGSVGSSIKQIEAILVSKGIELSSAFKVLMPDNYQVMYSPPSKDKQQRYFEAQEKKTQEMAKIIRNNQRIKFHEEGKYFTKAFGSLIYKTFKPYTKDKNFWNDDKCNGCSICSRVCPADNITMVENKPKWHNQCEHCLGCMQWCPMKSIQYNRGTTKRERYHHPKIRAGELFSSPKE
jgi:ferredoxin/flavodoxin